MQCVLMFLTGAVYHHYLLSSNGDSVSSFVFLLSCLITGAGFELEFWKLKELPILV